MAIYGNDSLDQNDAETHRLVRQEELLLAVTEMLTQALHDAGMTQAELARRLGRTPGYVSQVFGGGRNLTLRTVADIGAALSMRPAFKLTPEYGFESEYILSKPGALRWHTLELELQPLTQSVHKEMAQAEDLGDREPLAA